MLLLVHSTFVGHKLSDFPGGPGYSHRAPVIKAMWPGATIIWTAWIKQLRKWHILTILTIIWYTNQSKPHPLWGKSFVTDVSCLAVHVKLIWNAFSMIPMLILSYYTLNMHVNTMVWPHNWGWAMKIFHAIKGGPRNAFEGGMKMFTITKHFNQVNR